jgi:hypothetical protein
MPIERGALGLACVLDAHEVFRDDSCSDSSADVLASPGWMGRVAPSRMAATTSASSAELS